jgi:hypothetical protein
MISKIITNGKEKDKPRDYVSEINSTLNWHCTCGVCREERKKARQYEDIPEKT